MPLKRIRAAPNPTFARVGRYHINLEVNKKKNYKCHFYDKCIHQAAIGFRYEHELDCSNCYLQDSENEDWMFTNKYNELIKKEK